MRTRLFLAFFAVILTALISNFIFERLIMSDFDEYVMGAREDHLYWVLASVEGSKTADGWDQALLKETVHWAMMLGYDVIVRDTSGDALATARDVFDALPENMKRRMQGTGGLEAASGEYEEYPLFIKGEEIGALLVRPIVHGGQNALGTEQIFKRRGRDFLFVSFLIAGAGALFLSIIFSLFLSQPVRRLKAAAEAVSSGDLSVRVPEESTDELGLLSKAFNRMVETLKREETMRRRLTSNVAHELRTPLAVMKADVEAMLDGVITDRTAGLEQIQEEVEKLTALVRGVEEIARAEAGLLETLALEHVPLGEFLGGIAQGMGSLFKDKGLTLTLEGDSEAALETDAEKLETVLRNILLNSLRHTERGGVSIIYGKDGLECFITVRDTGPGIPEDDLPFVFERFYKGSGSTGTGLGLSIARELISAMGGRIELDTTPGEGAEFTVFLPVKGTQSRL